MMPNGYLDAMRVLNKILNPRFCWLSVVYLDDTLLAGEAYQECSQGTRAPLKFNFQSFHEKQVFILNFILPLL